MPPPEESPTWLRPPRRLINEVGDRPIDEHIFDRRRRNDPKRAIRLRGFAPTGLLRAVAAVEQATPQPIKPLIPEEIDFDVIDAVAKVGLGEFPP